MDRQRNAAQDRQAGCARRRWVIVWAVAVTIAVESVTLYLRFGRRQTAAEFNKTAPLLLQIHHMFWSVPLFLVLPFCWRWPKASGAILGTAIGFIVSDLAHHFIVLPLWVGNTGWHWP
ncbi:MAG TPA: hypothetical protein VFI31_15270 [Pirellulales bacterium]|nr:hypothetical protein [Pirellulales bacterium]